jgi:hypothetical protein
VPEQAQPNKPLSGSEFREIIVNDISSMLSQDGMLAPHIAYSRVSYMVTVKIMTNNPIIPNWTNRTKSKKSTEQQIGGNESMAAIEAFPMSQSPDDEILNMGLERTRDIISPNQSRIENGLAVPITVRGIDGDVEERKVAYDISMLPDDGGYPDGLKDRTLSDAEIKSED